MLFNLTQVFGDFIVCQEEWLNFSGGTDKSDERCYNFSIAKRPFLDGQHSNSDSLLWFSKLVLLSWIYFKVLVFVQQWLSPYLEIVIIFVSCSIDFPLRSMGDDPFYCKASDYTQTMVFIII